MIVGSLLNLWISFEQVMTYPQEQMTMESCSWLASRLHGALPQG